MKVLLVDDSEELLVLLKAVLVRLGHEVIAYPTAHAARECEEFDLALVDWNLDDANGVEFIQELSGKYPKAKLILISATRPDESTMLRLNSIKAKFESKPLTPMKLSQLVGA